MSLLDQVHETRVRGRRVDRLVAHVAPLLPADGRVLDVGCGDGRIARALLQLRGDVSLRGLDVLVRPETAIPVARFDGRTFPYDAGAFDAVLFVDVLHHAEDGLALLREAARVASRAVILKDHCADGLLAVPTLRFMDEIGNRRHGVASPGNYWPEARWRAAFDALGLVVETWLPRLRLYPWPASLVFDRRLHFVARLAKA
jgi:SAM-dependent methyltransferase